MQWPSGQEQSPLDADVYVWWPHFARECVGMINGEKCLPIKTMRERTVLAAPIELNYLDLAIKKMFNVSLEANKNIKHITFRAIEKS